MSAATGIAEEHQFPESIVNHEVSGILELGWSDGQPSRLSHGLLRARCKCASCQQLYRQQGFHPDIVSSIRLAAINPIADRGLNLVFSDGHSRGIFPWAYLHELSVTPPTEHLE